MNGGSILINNKRSLALIPWYCRRGQKRQKPLASQEHTLLVQFALVIEARGWAFQFTHDMGKILCLPPGAVGEESVGIACFLFETHARCMLSHSAVLFYFILFHFSPFIVRNTTVSRPSSRGVPAFIATVCESERGVAPERTLLFLGQR